MIISADNVQALIDDKSVTAYGIEKATGVPSSTIINVRNGKRKLENLAQDTMERLTRYYLKLNEPQRVFWDLEDKAEFMKWIVESPTEKWHFHMHWSDVYGQDATGKMDHLDYTAYTPEISIEPIDDVTEKLVDKYDDKYREVQNQNRIAPNVPVPLQPFYSDYQEVSFLSKDEMKIVVDRIRFVSSEQGITYDNEQLQSDDEILLLRTLTCMILSQSYPSVPVYKGINFRLDPLPQFASPTRLN